MSSETRTMTEAQTEALERAQTHAPAPLALALESLFAAPDLDAQARRVVHCFRVTLHLLALYALAARAASPAPAPEPAEVARRIGDFATRGHLTEGQWGALLRAVLAAWTTAPERHPLPALVGAFHGRKRADDRDLQGLQRLRNRFAHGERAVTPDDEVATEAQEVEALDAIVGRALEHLRGFLSTVEAVWRAASLVVVCPEQGPRRGALLQGLSTPRAPRPIRLPTDATGVVLVGEQSALPLSPFVLALPLSAGGFEVFVLDERARDAAVYVSPRSGATHVQPAGWAPVNTALAPGTLSGTLPPPAGVTEPFRGLQSFDRTHAEIFFGRRDVTRELVDTIDRTPLVILAGVSASGKTSLLHAGVIPVFERDEQLYRDVRPVPWRVVSLRPWDDPLGSLARALGDALARNDPALTPEARAARSVELARSIAAGGTSLGEILACEGSSHAWLLVVDQAEEVFTLCPDESVRERFAAALTALLDGPGAPGGRVVLATRDDYLGAVSSLGSLSRIADSRRRALILEPPSHTSRCDMLREPARRFGVEFEEGLVEVMAHAVEGQPAALAMLEFTAEQLWRKREGRLLTRRAYDELRGVEGALTLYAEQVWEPPRDHGERLIPDDATEANETDARREARQGAMRELLLRAVSDEGTRRPLRADELPDAVSRADAEVAIRRLVRGRLLVEREAREGGGAVFELIHEALITRWARFVAWRERDRRWRPLQRELHDAAEAWERHGRREDYLWRGERVAQVRSMRADAGGPLLTACERAFATASEAGERRRRVRGRVAMGVTTVALALFSGVVFGFWRRSVAQERRADRARDQAEALVQVMLFDLRNGLEPLGRLDLLRSPAEAVQRYYREREREGEGLGREALRQRMAAHHNVGDVLAGVGDTDGALREYRAGLTLAETLAAVDVARPGSLRDLSVSHEKVGEALTTRGDLAGALREHRVSLALVERLAAREPANLAWRRDLSVSHSKVGEVLSLRGDLDGALREFRRSLSLLDTLGAHEAANSAWLRDVSVSHTRVGEVLAMRGDLAGARVELHRGLEILERLTARDPSHSGWQADLAWSRGRIARVLIYDPVARTEALVLLTRAITALRTLRDGGQLTQKARRALADDEQLYAVLVPRTDTTSVRTLRVRVQSVQGLASLRVGSGCALLLSHTPAYDPPCRAAFVCGVDSLYGDMTAAGFFSCVWGEEIVGRDDATDDGDAGFVLDTAAGVVTVWDEVRGDRAAFRVEGRVLAPDERSPTSDVTGREVNSARYSGG